MSANPFDIETVLSAKHAQHVVLIHFPIALFVVGVFRSRRRAALLPQCGLAIEFLAFALVTLTAHLGGFLSGVNGPG